MIWVLLQVDNTGVCTQPLTTTTTTTSSSSSSSSSNDTILAALEAEIEGLEELIRLQTLKLERLQEMRVLYMQGARPPPPLLSSSSSSRQLAAGGGSTTTTRHDASQRAPVASKNGESQTTTTTPSFHPEDYLLLRGQRPIPSNITVFKTFTFQMVREGE